MSSVCRMLRAAHPSIAGVQRELARVGGIHDPWITVGDIVTLISLLKSAQHADSVVITSLSQWLAGKSGSLARDQAFPALVHSLEDIAPLLPPPAILSICESATTCDDITAIVDSLSCLRLARVRLPHELVHALWTRLDSVWGDVNLRAADAFARHRTPKVRADGERWKTDGAAASRPATRRDVLATEGISSEVSVRTVTRLLLLLPSCPDPTLAQRLLHVSFDHLSHRPQAFRAPVEVVAAQLRAAASVGVAKGVIAQWWWGIQWDAMLFGAHTTAAAAMAASAAVDHAARVCREPLTVHRVVTACAAALPLWDGLEAYVSGAGVSRVRGASFYSEAAVADGDDEDGAGAVWGADPEMSDASPGRWGTQAAQARRGAAAAGGAGGAAGGAAALRRTGGDGADSVGPQGGGGGGGGGGGDAALFSDRPIGPVEFVPAPCEHPIDYIHRCAHAAACALEMVADVGGVPTADTIMGIAEGASALAAAVAATWPAWHTRAAVVAVATAAQTALAATVTAPPGAPAGAQASYPPAAIHTAVAAACDAVARALPPHHPAVALLGAGGEVLGAAVAAVDGGFVGAGGAGAVAAAIPNPVATVAAATTTTATDAVPVPGSNAHATADAHAQYGARSAPTAGAIRAPCGVGVPLGYAGGALVAPSGGSNDAAGVAGWRALLLHGPAADRTLWDRVAIVGDTARVNVRGGHDVLPPPAAPSMGATLGRLVEAISATADVLRSTLPDAEDGVDRSAAAASVDALATAAVNVAATYTMFMAQCPLPTSVAVLAAVTSACRAPAAPAVHPDTAHALGVLATLVAEQAHGAVGPPTDHAASPTSPITLSSASTPTPTSTPPTHPPPVPTIATAAAAAALLSLPLPCRSAVAAATTATPPTAYGTTASDASSRRPCPPPAPIIAVPPPSPNGPVGGLVAATAVAAALPNLPPFIVAAAAAAVATAGGGAATGSAASMDGGDVGLPVGLPGAVADLRDAVALRTTRVVRAAAHAIATSGTRPQGALIADAAVSDVSQVVWGGCAVVNPAPSARLWRVSASASASPIPLAALEDDNISPSPAAPLFALYERALPPLSAVSGTPSCSVHTDGHDVVVAHLRALCTLAAAVATAIAAAPQRGPGRAVHLLGVRTLAALLAAVSAVTPHAHTDATVDGAVAGAVAAAANLARCVAVPPTATVWTPRLLAVVLATTTAAASATGARLAPIVALVATAAADGCRARARRDAAARTRALHADGKGRTARFGAFAARWSDAALRASTLHYAAELSALSRGAAGWGAAAPTAALRDLASAAVALNSASLQYERVPGGEAGAAPAAPCAALVAWCVRSSIIACVPFPAVAWARVDDVHAAALAALQTVEPSVGSHRTLTEAVAALAADPHGTVPADALAAARCALAWDSSAPATPSAIWETVGTSATGTAAAAGTASSRGATRRPSGAPLRRFLDRLGSQSAV